MIPSSVGMSPSCHASARLYRSGMFSIVRVLLLLKFDEVNVRWSSPNSNIRR